MRVDSRLLAMICLVGVAFVVTGLVIGKPSMEIEGAYFSRSVGVPAYSGVFAHKGPGLLDPANGNLWLGAGIVVLLAMILVLLLARVRSHGLLSS
jgi:hypothetical protein